MTHHTTQGTSRLDRAYANYHTAEQLYAGWTTTPLPWCKSLSSHRPIRVIRRTDADNQSGSRVLSSRHTGTPDWQRRTITLHQEMIRQTRGEDNHFKAILTLKRAMAMATTIMDTELQSSKAKEDNPPRPTTEQRLSILVAYLRAIHQGKTWRLGQLAEGVARALDPPYAGPCSPRGRSPAEN